MLVIAGLVGAWHQQGLVSVPRQYSQFSCQLQSAPWNCPHRPRPTVRLYASGLVQCCFVVLDATTPSKQNSNSIPRYLVWPAPSTTILHGMTWCCRSGLRSAMGEPCCALGFCMELSSLISAPSFSPQHLGNDCFLVGDLITQPGSILCRPSTTTCTRH